VRASASSRWTARATNIPARSAELGKRQIRLQINSVSFPKRLGYELVLLQAVNQGQNDGPHHPESYRARCESNCALLAERSVAQVEPDESDSKVEKWEQTAIEAIKQCGFGLAAENRCPGRFNDFVARNERFELSLLATLQPDAMHPSVHLRSFAAEKQRKPKLVAVWIGPERRFHTRGNERHPQSRCAAITLGNWFFAVKLPRSTAFQS